MTKIGLDAGHGGSSTGTYSYNTKNDGLYEKDHCLELVKLVAEKLKYNGFEVFLTRTTDVNPGDVSARAKACIKAKCNYAVSIHFNGFDNTSANGCEVFVPYAEKGAGIEAGYYKYLGKFFKLRAPFARSNNVNNRNEVYDKKLNTTTRKFDAVNTAKKDYFGFIRTSWASGLSADLLEVCFLTNPNDFKTYTENKNAIADAIARSIVEGYKKTYKAPAVVVPTTTARYRVIAGAFSTKERANAHVKALSSKGFAAYVEEIK